MDDHQRSEVARAAPCNDGSTLADVLQQAGLPLPSGERLPFLEHEIEDSIGARFAKVVSLVPGRIAIDLNTGQITYADLYDQVLSLASQIEDSNPGSTLPVALYGRTGITMIAAMFACFHLGRPYVFIDPKQPDRNIDFLLKDTKCDGIAICADDKAAEVRLSAMSGEREERRLLLLDPTRQSESNRDVENRAGPNSLAYIIYTSGSTGSPKGVPQSQLNVLADMQRQCRDLLVSVEDRYGLLYPLGSSAAICHVGGALLNGATLCPLDLGRSNLHDLRDWLEEKSVTILDINVSTFRQFSRLLEGSQNFPRLRILAPGSEPVHLYDIEIYRSLFSDNCVLQNAFGTSETRTATQYYYHKNARPIAEGERVTIGSPVEGKEILLLDESGKPAATSEPGEMVIRSRFVANEYWNNPEESEERFRQDPDDPEYILYHTCDLAKRLESGHLIHLERKDFSTKIRGYLVNFPEIEKVLRNHPFLEDAVITGVSDPEGGTSIAAFVIPRPGCDPKLPFDFSPCLRENLPDYMWPQRFHFLDEFPLLLNQKIDYRRLREQSEKNLLKRFGLKANPAGLDQKPGGTNSVWENRILQLWRELLQVDAIGIHDDFVVLGGDSLRALTLFARIEKEFQVAFTAVDVFEAFTVASMAERAAKLEVVSTPKEKGTEFLIPLKPGKSPGTIFMFPGGWGGDLEIITFAGIARLLKHDRKVFGVRSRARDPEWIANPAGGNLKSHLSALIPKLKDAASTPGPVTIIGECLAAVIAVESACRLEKAGVEIDKLILLDPWTPERRFFPPLQGQNEFGEEVPPGVQRYYTMVKRARNSRAKSNIHLVTLTDTLRIQGTIRHWKRKTSGCLHLHSLESNHDAFIREDAAKTSLLIESILNGKT